MRQGKSRAFYLETLLLVLFLLAVLAVLVQLFAAARRQSLVAERLTTAAQLARNVSEAFAATEDWQAFGQVLAGPAGLAWQQDEAALLPEQTGQKNGGPYTVTLRRAETAAGAGRMALLTVEVWAGSGSEPVYALTAQKYLPGTAAA